MTGRPVTLVQAGEVERCPTCQRPLPHTAPELRACFVLPAAPVDQLPRTKTRKAQQ